MLVETGMQRPLSDTNGSFVKGKTTAEEPSGFAREKLFSYT